VFEVLEYSPVAAADLTFGLREIVAAEHLDPAGLPA
jgi:hypothetical protein